MPGADPGDVANYEQKYPVGTTQNAAQFGIHQRVESFFAQLKSRRTGGLGGHGVAVKGIVKNAILYVAAIAAQNVKLFIGTLTRTKTAVCDAAEALAWLDQQSPVWLGVTEAFASRGQDP